ncbi:hypothetical protein QE152_g34399 [Popillia japonica]|uniref:Uncharacterized protein n=1 Tax=Popillia japonica TaxID=7064 RepID=A0AAW1ITU8_POPJA
MDDVLDCDVRGINSTLLRSDFIEFLRSGKYLIKKMSDKTLKVKKKLVFISSKRENCSLEVNASIYQLQLVGGIFGIEI